MSESARVVHVSPVLDQITAIVVNGVRSDASRRAYRHAIVEFLSWHAGEGHGVLNKAIVQEYRAELEQRGLAPSSINLRLSVIRKLAVEAADNGLLAPDLAAGILRVKGSR